MKKLYIEVCIIKDGILFFGKIEKGLYPLYTPYLRVHQITTFIYF